MSTFHASEASSQPAAFVAAPGDPDKQIPLVIDSPHSGLFFPAEARCIAQPEALKASWDAFVDELWAATPEVGGTLVTANFHRSFIDPNRSELDIDPEMLSEAWPDSKPSPLSVRGMGLIRRLALPGAPMYDRKLSPQEVKARIDDCYWPYHQTLSRALDGVHQRFGAVWHINCHSMKSVGNEMNVDSGADRPDVVVSDRNGTSADPAVTRWVAERWTALGYRVAINSPYQGGDIVRRYGQPHLQRHSIQIELNRRLYMDEKAFRPHDGFPLLVQSIRSFLLGLREQVSIWAARQPA